MQIINLRLISLRFLLILFLTILARPLRSQIPPTISGETTAVGTKSKPKWKLTGKEILLEIEPKTSNFIKNDVSKMIVPGIYAWNPDTSGPSMNSLTMLIEKGKHPTWSPHHKKIAFALNGDICLADLDGNVAPVFKDLPEKIKKSHKLSVQWNWQGRLFIEAKSDSWGTRLYNSHFDAESIIIDKIRYSHSWEKRFPEVIIPLRKRTEKPTWGDLLATNNATFSPDGKMFASEVYPTGPSDIFRGESRIFLYDTFEWSYKREEATKEAETAKEIGKWFFVTKAIPPIRGPGRRLTALSHESIELSPKWSPDNKWIAFSILNPSNGKQTVAIIQPNGEKLTEVGYKSVTSSKLLVQDPTVESWGHSYSSVLEWSNDGKYLWIITGESNELQVASYNGNQWSTESVANIWGNTNGIMHFASNGSRSAYVMDLKDDNQLIEILDIETKKKVSLPIPKNMRMNRMHW